MAQLIEEQISHCLMNPQHFQRLTDSERHELATATTKVFEKMVGEQEVRLGNRIMHHIWCFITEDKREPEDIHTLNARVMAAGSMHRLRNALETRTLELHSRLSVALPVLGPGLGQVSGGMQLYATAHEAIQVLEVKTLTHLTAAEGAWIHEVINLVGKKLGFYHVTNMYMENCRALGLSLDWPPATAFSRRVLRNFIGDSYDLYNTWQDAAAAIQKFVCWSICGSMRPEIIEKSMHAGGIQFCSSIWNPLDKYLEHVTAIHYEVLRSLPISPEVLQQSCAEFIL